MPRSELSVRDVDYRVFKRSHYHGSVPDMGKRKKSSRKPTGPKKREPLATSFRCVFCNHETSVSVKIDKKAGVGNLACKSCGQSFQTGINYLTQPVDVYADWIDACDAVAKDEGPTAAIAAPAARQKQAHESARFGLAPGEKLTDEDRNFIDNQDDDAELEYEED